MANKKKKIIDGATTIDSEILQPIFGGDSSASVGSPERDGHVHDGGTEWGHAQKVNLNGHVTGRLVLDEQYAVSKRITQPLSVATKVNFDENTNEYDGAIWYFDIPADIDLSKDKYFAFNWMGHYINNGAPDAVNSRAMKMRIIWQWYYAGYSFYSPSNLAQYGESVTIDGYTFVIPNNPIDIEDVSGSTNDIVVASQAYKIVTNNKHNGSPNYFKLTGGAYAIGLGHRPIMLGVQVSINKNTSAPFSKIELINSTLIYQSRTLGSDNLAFKSFT